MMNKLLLLNILVCLLLTNIAYSQRGYKILKADVEFAKQQVENPQAAISLFDAQPAAKSAASYSKMGEKWKKYPTLAIKNKDLSTLSEQRPYVLNLKIPVKGLDKFKVIHQEVELELVQFSVFSENFTQTLMPSGKVQTLEDIDVGITYRGVIKELDNSIAMVHIMDDELSIIMSSPEIGNIAVEKLKGTENEYLIYEDKELFANPFNCSAEESSNKGLDTNLPKSRARNSSVDGCFGIHFDVSNAIYTERGSGTSAYIQAIFSGVATLFFNEGISITLVSTKIWTSPEPFTFFLDSYSEYVGDNPVDATFSHYLLGFSAGGVAFTGATCAGGPNSEFSVGISNVGTDDFNPFPAFSYPVYIVSHELGHNFGSQHTHACVWNGNNTAIDGCGPTPTPCAGQDIPPPDQGTVMSFCETSGINLSLGFGPQPGDRIRSYASQITCNSYDCGNIDIDCTVNPGTITGGGTVCNSGGAMIGTPASGPGTIQYIWQRRTKCNDVYNDWATSQNNKLASLAIGSFPGQAQQWRRGAKSTECGGDWVYSNVLTFTNTCPPSSCIDCTVNPGTITGGGTVCNSGGAMIGTPASGPGTIQYIWQRRTKCNNVYNDWATSQNNKLASLAIGSFPGQAQQWRRGAKSTQCGGDWVYSNVLTFTNTCPPSSCTDPCFNLGGDTDGDGICDDNESTIENPSNIGGNTNPTNANGISLSFASPTNNATFNSGANLGVVVNASDSNGSIFFVQLAINGRFVRQENGAPYEWGTSNVNQTDAALRNLAPGTYTLTATAMDNGGNMQQASIRVTVGRTTTTTGGACAAEAVDNFIYNASTSVNTANGGTGFRGAWNIREAGGNIAFTNGSLGFSGVPTRGNKLTLDPSSSATSIKVFREFSQDLTSNKTLWVSMLMRVNDLTNGGVWLRLNDRQDIAIGKRWVNTFGIDNNGSGIPLVNGTTYRLVARYVFNSNSTDIALWINPTNNLNINTPYSTKTVGAISSITGLSLKVEGSSTGSYDIDALTFGCSLPNGLNFKETVQSRNATSTTTSSFAEQVSIYPNPTSNDLTIQLPPLGGKDMTLDIVNLTGQIVQSANLAIDRQATIQVPLNQSIGSGIYQVSIQVEGQEPISKKLVVQRN